MNQRIENSALSGNVTLFKWLAGLLFFLMILGMILSAEILRGGRATLGFILSAAPLGFFFGYLVVVKRWGSQFIEFTDKNVSYKIKREPKTTIPLEDIEFVEIKLHQINVHCKDGTKSTIDIETFQAYEDRIKVKKMFEKIMCEHSIE